MAVEKLEGDHEIDVNEICMFGNRSLIIKHNIPENFI